MYELYWFINYFLPCFDCFKIIECALETTFPFICGECSILEQCMLALEMGF